MEYEISTEDILERVLKDVELKVRDRNNPGSLKPLTSYREKKNYYIAKILEEKKQEIEHSF